MKYIKWYYKITRQLTQYDKKKLLASFAFELPDQHGMITNEIY